MAKTILVVCSLVMLFACTKDTNSSSTGKYYFSYTAQGKTYRYEGNYNIPLGIMEGGTFFAKGGAVPMFIVQSKEANCNTTGNPPCLDASFFIPRLEKGTFQIPDPNVDPSWVYLYITENQYSFGYEQSYHMDKGTITITEVGDVGGSVVGTFQGTATKVDDEQNEVEGVSLQGSFKLLRAL